MQYLYIIGIFQGILLFGLLCFDKNNTISNKWLGTWCLFLALSFIGPFITMDGEINIFSFLIGWSYFLPAGYGAFLYLYCKSAVVDKNFSMSDLKHFLPLCVCLLLNIDILLAPAEVKLAIIQSGRPTSILFTISELIQFSQAFFYLGLSIILVRQYQNKANSTLSNFNPEIFAWLWKLFALYFVIWSLKIIGGYINDYSILSNLADTLIVVLIYSIAMAQWRNPKLFYIEQLNAESSKKELDTSMNNSVGHVQLKSKSSNALDDSIRESLLDTISLHMKEQQSFLDNKLTLSRLADAIGITTHHLSEVLNQQEGKNFYQYVNEYRINYICDVLEKNQSIKLLDLAMNAGFSSKSTFNAVFKQVKGATPSKYRDSLKS
jgi:AraC-like DNA-binding protein